MRFKPVLFSLSVLMSSSAFAKGSDVNTAQEAQTKSPTVPYQLVGDGWRTWQANEDQDQRRKFDDQYEVIPFPKEYLQQKEIETLDLDALKKDLSPRLREMLDEMIKCEKKKKEDVPLVNNLIEAVQIVSSRSKQPKDKNQIVESLIDLSPKASARDVSTQLQITTSDSYLVLNKMRALRGAPNSVQLAGVPEELPEISKPCLSALFDKHRYNKYFPENNGEYVRRHEFMDEFKGMGSPPKIEADN